MALTASFPAEGLTHPVFFTHSLLAKTQMSMVYPGDGQPVVFRYSLEPRLAIAFVSSTVGTEIDQHTLEPAQSSFASMAKDVYGRSIEILGEYLNDAGETTVVSRRGNSGP